MKNKVRFALLCLLVQAFFVECGLLSAQTATPDTLSWTWEVTTTISTRTKTCVLEFTDSVSVDWGDGIVEWINDSLSKKTLTHVYGAVGNYSCTVAGPTISYFKADSRRLLSLHPEKAPNLTYISCTSSQLTTLDLSRNTKLESLYCGGNDLQSLNLSANIRLQTLTCSDNKLKRLDLSGLTQLKKVTCHTNPLTSLSVNPAGALNYVSCSSCSLSAQALDSLFEQLPVLPEASTSQNLFISGNPGSADCHPELAAVRKWTLEKTSIKSIMYIPPVSVKKGNTAVMSVYLDNVQPIVAFEMDLALPEGLTLDTLQTTLMAARTGAHQLSVAKVSTTTPLYKIMAYSLTSKDTLLGRQGALLNLYIQVPDTLRTYTIDIKKVILVDTAANSADVTLSDGKLSVLPAYTLGDADKDDRVNVTDIVWLVALINGRFPSECQKEAIDMDGNGVWNIVDVVRLVDAINSTTYQAVSPAGYSMVNLPSKVTRENGIFLKQPYNITTATNSNHLYLNQSPEDPTRINLCLDNHEGVQALQADIILPETLSLIPEASKLTVRCASTHTFTLVPVSKSENRYRLVIWSMSSGMPFSGNAGELVTLSVKAKEIKTGSGKEELKGSLEQTVLTGLDMTTLNSFSYETELEMPGKQPLIKVAVGSGQDGTIWVKGENLEHITVYDVMGRTVTERACYGERVYNTAVGSGCYVVKVQQGKDAVGVYKVLVR